MVKFINYFILKKKSYLMDDSSLCVSMSLMISHNDQTMWNGAQLYEVEDRKTRSTQLESMNC